MIVVLSKRKPAAQQNKTVLLNASQRVRKGRPKNYISEEDLRPLAAVYLKGEPVESEIAVITREQTEETDYNLSPSRWILGPEYNEASSVSELIDQLATLSREQFEHDEKLLALLKPLTDGKLNDATN